MRPLAADLVLPSGEFHGLCAGVCDQCRVRRGSGRVEAFGVFLHHAVRVEDRHDRADGFAHEIDPRDRKPSVGLRVIERQDLRLEHMEEAVDIHLVLVSRLRRDRALGDFRADGPAILARVRLAPPAVEDAEVQAAARWQFHAARAARFERAARIVQPEVHALIEAAADVVIVVLDEDDAPLEFRHPAEAIHVLDEPLPRLVLRVRLSGEDKLHRPISVVQQPLQALDVAEEQSRALVGRKAPREADREHLGIQHGRDRTQPLGRLTETDPLVARACADEINRASLLDLVRVPDLLVGNILHLAPEIPIREMLLPVRHVAVVEPHKVRRHPRLRVDAVRHARDRHLVLRHSVPHMLPQPLRHMPVKLGDAVRVAARAQCEDRHAERLRGIHARLAEAREGLEVNFHRRGIVAEIFPHQIERERIVPRGHGRVRGEDIA